MFWRWVKRWAKRLRPDRLANSVWTDLHSGSFGYAVVMLVAARNPVDAHAGCMSPNAQMLGAPRTTPPGAADTISRHACRIFVSVQGAFSRALDQA